MQPFRESANESAERDRLAPSLTISVPVDLAVMAGTVPLLALVIGSGWIAEGMVELGKASEELFRGERLPSRPLMRKSSAAIQENVVPDVVAESSDDKKS